MERGSDTARGTWRVSAKLGVHFQIRLILTSSVPGCTRGPRTALRAVPLAVQSGSWQVSLRVPCCSHVTLRCARSVPITATWPGALICTATRTTLCACETWRRAAISRARLNTWAAWRAFKQCAGHVTAPPCCTRVTWQASTAIAGTWPRRVCAARYRPRCADTCHSRVRAHVRRARRQLRTVPRVQHRSRVSIFSRALVLGQWDTIHFRALSQSVHALAATCWSRDVLCRSPSRLFLHRL